MVTGKMFAPSVSAPDADKICESVFGRVASSSLSEREIASLWRGVIYDDNSKAVAAGDIWYDGAFVLGSLGVLSSERGKGYGDLLIRLLLYKAQTHFAKRVTLLATPETVSFFSRYGFRLTDGYEMEIDGDKIDLDTCSGCSGI